MADKISLQQRLSELSTDANQPMDLQSYKIMKRNQTVAIVFVAVLGIAIISFGFWKMHGILQIPFPGTDEKFNPDKMLSSQTEVVNSPQEEDPAVLKQRDTDQDGLTDFEELKIYQTSPYLADTDSDGYSDIEEIKAQEDPTCPRGQNCFRTSDLYVQEQQEIEMKEEQLNLTADQIRALLLETGQFSSDQVYLFTDEELLGFYEQLLIENPELARAAQVELPISNESTNQAASVAQAENLTPDQIRDLLREQGISEADIAQIDDATLLKLYKEAFSQAKEKMDQ